MSDYYQSGFCQQGPVLGNTWAGDDFLRACLARLLPDNIFTAIAPGLEHLGERAAGEMLIHADDA